MLRGVVFVAMAAAAAFQLGCKPEEDKPPAQSNAASQIMEDCESDDDCSGDTCCEGNCANLAFNAYHCDACGTECGGGESCFEGSCRPAAFAGVCDAKGLIQIKNGFDDDDAAGRIIGNAIADACDLDLESVEHLDGDVTDDEGNILPGAGEVLVVPGGIYVSPVAEKMEIDQFAAVYFLGDEFGDGSGGFYEMDGDEIVSWGPGDVGETRDFFVLQISPDPVGSRFVIQASGAAFYGTRAAARFFVDQVANDFRGATERWYVVEWNDEDEDGQPSSGDSYEVHGDG